jgi:chromosome partitioning protein
LKPQHLIKIIKKMKEKNPKVIAVINQKGGCGKTTVSINITHSFMRNGYKALLVDSDIQGTATSWHETTEGGLITVMPFNKPSLYKSLDAIKHQYDIIVIDGPPGVNNVTSCAISIADLVLIPTVPSAYDIWAIVPLLRIIENSPTRPIAIAVLTKVIARTKIIKEAIEELTNIGLPYLCGYDRFGNARPVQTSYRVVYPTASSHADTVYTTKADGAFAAQLEIDAIRIGLETLLELKKEV